MKLRDMKMKAGEMEEAMAVEAPKREEYPYGLRLELGKQEMGKLMLDPDDLQAGEYVTIMARARIKSINTHEEEGKVCQHCSLQIEKLAMHPDETEEKEKDGSLKAVLKKLG